MTLVLHFFVVVARSRRKTFQISRFVEAVNSRLRFLFFLTLKYSLKNSTAEKLINN